MKTIKNLFLLVALSVAQVGISQNPFLDVYSTPHQTIPFNAINSSHFLPAFQEAIKQHNAEIDAIINNPQAPDFENTIVALGKSGRLLKKVGAPFHNLLGAETNDALDSIARIVSPILTDHYTSLGLNEKLFARVKAVYAQKDKLKLTPEQQMLLQNSFDDFADNGANLSASDKVIFSAQMKELSDLTLQFGQNVLKETNKYSLLISDKKQLAGLPDDVLDMLAINAKKAGKEGWLLNLKATTFTPFMKYADNRELRHTLYTAYLSRCLSGGEYDNREIVRKIVNARLKIANLLGHKSYADYVLKDRMAQNRTNVYALLDKLLLAYKPTAWQEYREVQYYAAKHGANFRIEPWDWSYYSEKLKDEKYAVNDEMLKPYFELEHVKKGVFGLATRLYGIHFTKNDSIQVYHPEVDAYDVTDANGKFLAVLYTDFHPRNGKRAGAWTSSFKSQWMEGLVDNRPQVTIVMNFTRPTSTKPALLTFDELTTFLHEFGHSLHGMLTRCTYESLSGTSVYRDFVELPSQLMENWASQKAFLDDFAKNYLTSEKIPARLVRKIKDSENFNVANLCLRQLGLGYLDMAWHSIENPFEGDVVEFEKKATEATQILPVPNGIAITPQFSHIFAGGYASGYYGYKWAEVLDADAFSLFLKNGIFDQKTAGSFRTNILEKGGSEHPMVLYKRFRGQEPTIDALLKRNGIVQ